MPRSIPAFLGRDGRSLAGKDRHRLGRAIGDIFAAARRGARHRGMPARARHPSGDRVGICMEKSVDQVSAILGVSVRQCSDRADSAAPQAAEHPSHHRELGHGRRWSPTPSG